MNWVPDGFEEAGPRSRKLRCVICRETGYRDGRWMDRHRRPHLPCKWCGRRFPPKLDGTARVHTRCPKRPPELSPPAGNVRATGTPSVRPEDDRRTDP